MMILMVIMALIGQRPEVLLLRFDSMEHCVTALPAARNAAPPNAVAFCVQLDPEAI